MLVKVNQFIGMPRYKGVKATLAFQFEVAQVSLIYDASKSQSFRQDQIISFVIHIFKKYRS